MVPSFFASVIAFVVLLLIGAVAAEFTRSLWRHRPVLGWGFAITGVALIGWVQFLVTWASSSAGSWFAALLLAAVLVAGGYLRIWRLIQSQAAVVTLMFGIMLAYFGFMYLWSTPLDVYATAALRFAFGDQPYPADNLLPLLFANALGTGQGTHEFFLSWNGSDRPPLQSGVDLILLRTVGMLPNPAGGAVFPADSLSFGTGFVLQLAWVPTVWMLLKTFGVTSKVAVMSILFTGATATMLINTTYTWPKLISASLVIFALVLLVELLRGRLRMLVGLPVAALAYALAMLCHGAAALALPAVVVLAVVALWRRRPRIVPALTAAALVLITYVPWMLYQRFADPPGDRLLKWHLAGVIELTDRSFVRTFLDSYASLSFSDWIHAKLANLSMVFSPFIAEGFTGTAEESLGSHRYHEYYETSAALSLAALLLLVIAVFVVVALARRQPLRHRGLLLMMLLMVPCILVWCLLIFLPANTVVHQGSHVWIIVLIAGSFAWVCSIRSWLGWLLIAAQVAITAWFYTPFFHYPQVKPAGIAVLVIGILIVAAAVALERRRRQRQISKPAPGATSTVA